MNERHLSAVRVAYRCFSTLILTLRTCICTLLDPVSCLKLARQRVVAVTSTARMGSDSTGGHKQLQIGHERHFSIGSRLKSKRLVIKHCQPLITISQAWFVSLSACVCSVHAQYPPLEKKYCGGTVMGHGTWSLHTSGGRIPAPPKIKGSVKIVPACCSLLLVPSPCQHCAERMKCIQG